MFREGPEGFKGGMSAGKYSTITAASPATTTRDLADLTEKGALIREGERRHARYKLSVSLRHVPHISVNERGELIDEYVVLTTSCRLGLREKTALPPPRPTRAQWTAGIYKNPSIGLELTPDRRYEWSSCRLARLLSGGEFSSAVMILLRYCGFSLSWSFGGSFLSGSFLGGSFVAGSFLAGGAAGLASGFAAGLFAAGLFGAGAGFIASGRFSGFEGSVRCSGVAGAGLAGALASGFVGAGLAEGCPGLAAGSPGLADGG
jgi:DNA-binding transcriptional ArsR family regulator